jgi:ribosomal protein S18 acetylase RimI-like enzyme
MNGNELVGYLASVLVVASLAMTSVVRLRMLSLAGSIAFVVYGTLIDSVPIVLTNAAIAVLNIWFLSRELSGRRDLGVIRVPSDSPFLLDFLRHHVGEIRQFQPDFDPAATFDFALVLTRDGLPAGALLGRQHEDTLEITLDHVLRAYRDSRIGAWLYGKGASVFRSAGITQLVTAAGNDAHRGYLQRVGFHPAADGTYARTV